MCRCITYYICIQMQLGVDAFPLTFPLKASTYYIYAGAAGYGGDGPDALVLGVQRILWLPD
jgi:hypothetical protein